MVGVVLLEYRKQSRIKVVAGNSTPPANLIYTLKAPSLIKQLVAHGWVAYPGQRLIGQLGGFRTVLIIDESVSTSSIRGSLFKEWGALTILSQGGET